MKHGGRKMSRMSRVNLEYMAKLRIVILSLLAFNLSACSSYSSKFSCSDAKGLTCAPMRIVDLRIDSGQIEEIEAQDQCRGSRCKKVVTIDKPKVKDNNIHKINLQDEVPEQEFKEGNSLYLK